MSVLKQFLLSAKYYPNDNLVLAIVRRVDTDADAKIGFLEFVEFVTPQRKPSRPEV